MLSNRLMMGNPPFGGIDSYAKIMMHFNSNYIDSSLSPKTFTNNGASINTTTYKFGGGSVYFNGTSWIDTIDSSDFDIGSGDFTIDCWFKKAANNETMMLCAQSDSSASNISFQFSVDGNGDNKPSGGIRSGSTFYGVSTSSTAVTDTNWHHLALVRYGNAITLYLDGNNVGSGSCSGITANNSSYKMAIGRCGEYNGLYFNGYLDEFRFSKGIARWTNNFNPPSTEYTLL